MTEPRPLVEVIADAMANWGSGTSVMETPVFGTSDPAAIAAQIDEVCRIHLGTSVAGAFFSQVSAGYVTGLRLDDGRDVVMKAYQDRWTETFLSATTTVQRHLADCGFPCPAPIAGPFPLQPDRANLAVVESFVADDGMAPYSHPDAARISAEGLAHLVNLCRQLPPLGGLAKHPLSSALSGSLYGMPHTPLFDFEATADGAEWIDEFAVRAVALRDATPRPHVIAHGDWCARNVRITPGNDATDTPDTPATPDKAGRIEAVFDWDSVMDEPETVAVGQAAASWCVTSEPGARTFPTPDGIADYINLYEAASTGEPWTDAHRRAAAGAAVYLLAYISRCEHALAGRGWHEPVQDGGRTRLREHGEAILSLYD